MSETVEAAVGRILSETPPNSLLLVGRSAPALFEVCRSEHSGATIGRIVRLDAPVLAKDLGRFDLVLASGALEYLPRIEGRAMLGRLRDVHARRLLLQVRYDLADGETPWTMEDCLAFGLTRLATTSNADGVASALYGFSLHDYKHRPDWLNPSNWAHPHLWKP